jgi:hypothetical protein
MLGLLAAQMKFKSEKGKLHAGKPIWVDVSIYQMGMGKDVFYVMGF